MRNTLLWIQRITHHVLVEDRDLFGAGNHLPNGKYCVGQSGLRGRDLLRWYDNQHSQPQVEYMGHFGVADVTGLLNQVKNGQNRSASTMDDRPQAIREDAWRVVNEATTSDVGQSTDINPGLPQRLHGFQVGMMRG